MKNNGWVFVIFSSTVAFPYPGNWYFFTALAGNFKDFTCSSLRYAAGHYILHSETLDNFLKNFESTDSLNTVHDSDEEPLQVLNCVVTEVICSIIVARLRALHTVLLRTKLAMTSDIA